MNVIELLKKIKLSGCKLDVEGSNLRVKGKLPPQLRDQVIANKNEIISLLGNNKKTVLQENSRNGTDKFPAHNGQRGLWFISQQPGATAAYVEPGYRYYLTGDLNLEALNQAFSTLVKRHEIIRTTYHYTDNVLWQRINPASSFKVKLDDLRELDSEQQKLQEKALLESESYQPFELDTDLMLRVRLVRFSDDEYLLFMVMHHIAMDGWSWRVITAELQSLYNHFVGGSLPAIPAPTYQYTDYGHWRSEGQFEQNIAPSLAYWVKQLEGAPELHSLPLDNSRTSAQTYVSQIEAATLSVAETASLYQLARDQGVTLFTVLHAVLAVVLSRHSGEKDIVVGSPFSGRTNFEFEAMIGFFVNTLALRTDLHGDPQFCDLLAQVNQTIKEADQHQDLPFDMLVDKLHYSRSSAYSPVFQIMLVLLNMDLPQLDLDGIRQTLIGQPVYTQTKYDISLVCFEENQQLTLNFEYCSALFKPETIQQLTRHVRNTIQCVTDNPTVKLSDITMLTDAERSRLLNNHPLPQSSEPRLCIHHLFEQQVAKTPDATALEYQGEAFSYSILNQRANQLAYQLIERGVGPDRPVALCMNRTPDLIVALISVLKAGGTYVSVDPKYPLKRQAFILADSNCHLLLTEKEFNGNFSDFDQEILLLENYGDFINPAIVDESKGNPEAAVMPDHLSHLIYTSGSTGKPKGVMVEHRNVVALLDWTFNTYSRDELKKVLFSTSLNFDLSIFELWAPLLSGGAVLLIDDIARLAEEASLEPTLINSVPSALYALLEASAIPDSVKTLNVAGEPLSSKLVNLAFSKSKIQQLYNLYGPSEDTTYSTYACFTGYIEAEPCIGKPIDNTFAYVLDDAQALLPEGAIGELYLSGQGVARGYLNREDLNESCFIANPFAMSGHERLYKTGDLVRWGAGGDLEYIGRKDHQVKVRGFRIELGEVESALSGLECTRDQAVIVKTGESGEKQLVGYVTLTDTVKGDNEQVKLTIRDQLNDAVPDYMVPGHIVVLDTMPLTKNGKVDRHALRAMDYVAPQEELVSPTTSLESTLFEIWQSVLGARALGVNTNFFSAGGDSILAIQLVSKARKAGIKLTSQLIFEHQTIAQLANVVDAEQAQLKTAQPPAEGEQKLTPIMQAFFEQEQEGAHHYNQSMLFNLPDLTRPELHQVLAALWQRHDVFRLAFNYHEPSAAYRPFTPEMIDNGLVELDLREEEGSQYERVVHDVVARAQQQLAVDKGDLARCIWIRQQQGDQLLWVMHHLVTDGVTWRIIAEDLTTALANLASQSPLLARPEGDSFQYWAEYLHDKQHHPRWLAEREYWVNESKVSADLPVDHDIQGPSLESETDIVTVSVPEPETSCLLQQASQTYNTRINELLLAALAPVLLGWAGGNQFRIDMEGHGRDIDDGIDLSETAGWLTSLYPVGLVAQDSISEQIVEIKEKLRALPSNGIGYGVLRYVLRDEELSSGQVAEVVFNYLGQFVSDERVVELNSHLGGDHISPKRRRQHKLGINGLVKDGCLTFRFDYSGKQYNRSTIIERADAFIEQLKVVIKHCLASERRVYTASDFPLAELSSDKLTLLQQLIPNVADVYRVTPTQHGMLFHSLSNPDTAMYNNILKVGLGPIEADFFKESWSELITNHSVLRTVFYGIEEEFAHQVIVKQCNPVWRQLDWRGNQQIEADLAAFIEKEKYTPFDLTDAPLMRFTLVRESNDHWTLIWSFHHALLDGWSIPILLDELKVLYAAKVAKSPIGPRSPVPYSTYVDWLLHRDYREAKSYWLERLADFPEATRFSSTSSNTPAGEARKETINVVLSEDLTHSLKTLASGASVTLNSIIQGAWGLLLSKYSNSSDVVFGQTVSGRSSDLKNIDQIVGLCINSLPVRVRIPDNNESLTDWLKSIHKAHSKDEVYGFASLLDIQNWCNAKGGLFESLVVFENYPSDILSHDEEIESEGIRYKSVEGIEQNNYPLSVIVIPGAKISIHIDYDMSYITPSDAERLGQYFEALLGNMAEGGAKKVSECSLMAKPLEQTFNSVLDEKLDSFDTLTCIHTKFEQVAAATPDAIALELGSDRMSYQVLNRHANRLARQLIEAGIKPDSLVGLHTSRSFELVIGVLGILKAGAAYVPLDPNYPEQRVRYILGDAKLGAIVTDGHFDYAGVDDCVVYIERATVTEKNDVNPVIPNLTGHNLAYVIYTSGSTGNPKGVMVEHRNVVRLFAAADIEFSFDHTDVWTLFHSYAFDFSVWELWGALIYGGRLVIVTYEETRSPEQFFDLLCEQQVTVLNQTPSAFYNLSRAAVGSGRDTALRYVVFGGEALDFNSLSDWFADYGDDQPMLVNMYGITETTVHVTYQRIRQQDCEQPLSVIGKPLADLRAYVCDAQLNLLPVGVPGELLVGGKGVTRGYLNRPQLTRERFIANTFSPDRADILYRSGDLVKWLEDGNLEYLGRIDQQVKIRGFRIELGEIESSLRKHPLVRQAAVFALAADGNHKRLVGYIEADEGTNGDDVREYLSSHLPDYMVPSSVIRVDDIPLTNNGKVNRDGLFKLTGDEPSGEFIAAQTEEERVLTDVVGQVLKRKRVSVSDNFFAIGGDSILSLRVVSSLRGKGYQCTVSDIFKAETIGRLATLLAALDTQESDGYSPFSLLSMSEKTGLSAVEGGEHIVDAYPASAMQSGMVYHAYLEPDSDIYHDVFSFRLSLPWDEECFYRAVKTMVSRHELLRTGFILDPAEGSLIQAVYDTADPQVSVFDLQSRPQREHRDIVEGCIKKEREPPFELQETSLIRLFVHLLGREQFILTLSFSHAVLDGWSVSRFNTELFQIYAGLLNGREYQLEVQPAPYHRFIEQEMASRRDTGLRHYWSEHLSGATVTSVPFSVASSLSDGRESRYSHTLDGLKDRLVALAERLEVPLNHLLLAGHFKVLSLMSGDTDVLSCVVSNGRPALAGGDITLGLFLNSLPLRHQLGRCSWSELIKTVSRMATESIEYRMYPVSDIQHEMSLNFDKVLFNYTHFHSYEALEAIDGIEFEPYAKYEASNFEFVVQFIRMPSAELLLELQYPRHAENDRCALQLEECYELVFSRMVEQPETLHCGVFDEIGSNRWNALLGHTESAGSASTLLPVHQMVEQQANVSAGSNAVVFKDISVSYQVLNERANQLAHYLIERGIGAGSLVGVLLERSVEMVVSLLAVMKSGAAYVPLDPNFPRERIASVLDDAECALVVCSPQTAEVVNDTTTPKAVLSEIWQQVCTYSAGSPNVAVDDSSLAYVIYTSGSTGKPKGVQIEHQALSNFIAAVKARYATVDQDHTLALTTISFDIAALELFLPLVSGAMCVLGCKEDALSGARVQALIDRHHIRLIQATPSGYQLLLEGGDWKGNDGLQILCGGEALSVSLAKQLVTKGKTLWNQYGPTEATIWVTACEVTRSELEVSDGYLPVGGWLENCSGMILNELGESVPQGVPGELYLSGACLARGYINRDELTSASFVYYTLGGQPEQRLYKTGDKVRLSETGNIEFLGRLDHQVKIRGHRIELGDIEATLNQYSGVKETTVIADDQRGDKQLLAYVVPLGHAVTAGQDLVEGIQAYLKEKLPEYMIPSAVTVLASMPLTPNGKVDRKALPKPDRTIRNDGVPLATPTEHQLASIWQRVLDLIALPYGDSDFFALGGHSLLAVKLAVKVRTQFGCELPLKVMLVERKLALMAEFIDNAKATSRPQLIQRSDQSIRLPTYAQQRMWFIEQAPNGAGAYNMPMVINLRGNLDIARLTQVIARRVQRFEALRTVFDENRDYLEMKLLPAEQFELTVIDLSGLDEDEKAQARSSHVDSMATTPFNLSRDYLLRGELLVLAKQHYQLVLTMHHIASDGWSWGVFIDEVNRDYHPRSEAELTLPALPIEVADFAEVQRQWLASEKEVLLGYWQQQLAELPVVHSIPTDYKRPNVQNYRGGHYHFRLYPALTAKLKACCERENVTLFMLLQTAFSVLLSRYSGESDIIMGTPVAGREYEELESQVGLFVNTVIVRSEVSGDSTFSQLLKQAKQTISAALEHQDVPFEWLVEALRPERSTAHTPLFQVLFAMQNIEQPSLLLEHIDAEWVMPQEAASRFDLSLYCGEDNQEIWCFFEYALALFKPETIERMSQHFENLLVDVVGSMEKKVSALALLDDTQRQGMLDEWNQTDREYSKDLLIHQWIERQAKVQPDAIALVFGNEILSYGELNRRANQLAHYLLQHTQTTGGPDTLIGVCMERSTEMVLSLLAVLKAGMAYVPFDPGYPQTRLDYMLDDSGVDIALIQTGLLASSQNRKDVIVEPGFFSTVLAQYPATNPSLEIGLSDLAYVIYTSGSTGRPKGVMVGHGAILNRLQWMQEAFCLTDQDKVLQKTPFSFDVSVWEFFWPLMYGAQLVIAKPGGHKNSAYLAELIAGQGITTVHFVPSMLQLFVEEQGLELCDRLRYVFCSGEALPYDLQQRFFDVHPTAELHNLYGPTEAAVDVTWWPCQRGCDSGKVPIGRPIANIQTLVLDGNLQPVPVGVPGELYLGGEGLARGYLNKPELTASSFIPHPFALDRLQRLYKTGDKVQWLPDGSIEYLGRLDHQIKLRGFRIELGEIEAALLEIDVVREAIVLVNQDLGTTLLVAYVVRHDSGLAETGMSTGDMKKHLKANLPEYLVPAYIIAVDQMPLTPNGKLDRKALPAPDFNDEGAFVAPQNEVEQSLSDIWYELLSVRSSTDKSFFDVGGHSLLAIKLISLVKKCYPQVNVTVQTIFERQSIALLAEEIERQLNIIENQNSYQKLAEVADLSEVEF